MEFIIELLFEFILEGTIELGSHKKVPMPLRILATMIILVCYFGLGGLLIYGAYTEPEGPEKIFIYLCGFFIFGGGIYIVYKMYKKKTGAEEEDIWN